MVALNETLAVEVFGDKSEQALTLLKDASDKTVAAVPTAVAEALGDLGITARRHVIPPRPVDRQLALLDDIFKNNGLDRRNGKRYTFDSIRELDRRLVQDFKDGKKDPKDYQDFVTFQEQPMLFPRVVTGQIREALEPEMVLTNLFQQVRYTNGPTLIFPTISPAVTGNMEIGEATEYPEQRLEWSGQVAVTIGKHGIKVSMTEEAMLYSQWDIWSLHLRAAGRTLGRHKEGQAIKKVFEQGTTFIDNTDPVARHTTGRGDDGMFNGTFTVWDLFDMAADLIQDGYRPDTIVIHPFAWPIFALDPVMRTMALLHNGRLINGYQGSPGSGAAFDPGGLLQQRGLAEPAARASTFAQVPSAYPFGPMQIIVTPHAPYNRANSSTTIYLCDSQDVGILVVQEDLVAEEWNTPEKDIRSIKFRERYNFGSANDGRAIRKAVGVVVARAYHFDGGVLTADVTLGTSVHTVT